MILAGIYIHIPFCRSRCSYCDFATGMYERDVGETYVVGLWREISKWKEIENPLAVDTIYFGGGTPSLVAPAQIERILKAVHERFEVVNGAEVTIELNPASVGAQQANIHRRDPENAEVAQRNNETELPLRKLSDFRRLGINRASFGAQTFDDQELKQLGRTHTSADIPATFHRFPEPQFENINFHLIPQFPAQPLIVC